MLARIFRKKVPPAPAPKSRDLQVFEIRMREIKRIADRNMRTAQYGKSIPIRDEVVVPWNDLLVIWDLADKALSETPVP